jgi:molecular chaperone GrpE
VEAILADFRSWLQQQPAAAADLPLASPAETPAVDLHTLLAQFVALRHEVNLQTRAVRAQQEQNADTLEQFGQAVQTLQQTAEGARRADALVRDEQIRPVLKTLVDLADALGLARREILRLQQKSWSSLERLAVLLEPQLPSTEQARPGFWARWFGSRRHQTDDQMSQLRQERGQLLEAATAQVAQLLESVLTGYSMSLQRVERALQNHGLEPMACTGEPFDPETMEVIEVVADSGRPSGEVLEEVRAGYSWQGRVFRFAQVRVAKS